jgi:hypothetical protein
MSLHVAAYLDQFIGRLCPERPDGADDEPFDAATPQERRFEGSCRTWPREPAGGHHARGR